MSFFPPDAALLPPLGSMTAPVQVRIAQRDNGNRYGAAFALADEKKNDETHYKALAERP